MQSLGLVPALDLETLDDLKRVVDATCDIDEVIEYKLGMHAVLHIGLFNAVKAIREFTDKPVIYDHQKAGADMPDSGAGVRYPQPKRWSRPGCWRSYPSTRLRHQRRGLSS